MSDLSEVTEEQIRASIERDMKDPAYMANLRRSLEDMRSGNFVDVGLPRWLPWTVRRALTVAMDPLRYYRFMRFVRRHNTQKWESLDAISEEGK